MGDPVTWFDLGAADPEPLKGFYSELFGWKLRPMGGTYTVLLTGGGMTGGIGRSQTGDPWIAFYAEVEDPQATLDRAVSLGGTVVVKEAAGKMRLGSFDSRVVRQETLDRLPELEAYAKKLIYQFKYRPYLSDLNKFLADLMYESIIQKENFDKLLNACAPLVFINDK